MKTVTIEVEDAAWEATEKAAREANAGVSRLVQDYLVRVAEGTALMLPAAEFASRKRLLELLKECNIALDGRPTRESFYTDRRFH